MKGEILVAQVAYGTDFYSAIVLRETVNGGEMNLDYEAIEHLKLALSRLSKQRDYCRTN